MVSIRKKTIGGKNYYYLRSNTREGYRVHTTDKYLGNKIPKNIEAIKEEFIKSTEQLKWYKLLDQIKKEYDKEIKSMPKSIKKKQLDIFVTRFTYDTQRIEGSTLSLQETANLLEKGITPKNKPIPDVKEAEAHKKLFLDILSSKNDLSLNTIRDWHWNLFKETKPDIAGKLRKYQVGISGSKFKPPLPVEVFPMLQEFFKWYNNNKKHKGKKYKIHPVELAGLVHLKFVTIHPFGDGNGRISRLMMNFILNKYQYPLLNISHNNRISYYNALERAQIMKDQHIFIKWFIKKYIKENTQLKYTSPFCF